ncbi:hypothetical protein [Microbacterium album]|uniref:Uncharacterized protein n=1 Tax=Microbacterium album TaxID=2053191 RepID=A0A917IHH0_9MICO|nr:hypothetical protein [Microbacterium album]GGH47463.1 hypothetical protein GCM10010921_24210 [Microbacterium album]
MRGVEDPTAEGVAEHGQRAASRPPAGRLTEWLTREGVRVSPSGDAQILIDEGEAVHTVSERGGVWTVQTRVRDDDRGPVVRSARWEDIERFVMMVYFSTIRRKHGLSPVGPLARAAADGSTGAADGYSISPDPAGGVTLIAPDGRTVWFTRDIQAAAFSRYDKFTADELRAQATTLEAALAERAGA